MYFRSLVYLFANGNIVSWPWNNIGTRPCLLFTQLERYGESYNFISLDTVYDIPTTGGLYILLRFPEFSAVLDHRIAKKPHLPITVGTYKISFDWSVKIPIFQSLCTAAENVHNTVKHERVLSGVYLLHSIRILIGNLIRFRNVTRAKKSCYII